MHTTAAHATPRAPGSSMNWFSWLAKVPAMNDPRNTVMTCITACAAAACMCSEGMCPRGEGRRAGGRPPPTRARCCIRLPRAWNRKKRLTRPRSIWLTDTMPENCGKGGRGGGSAIRQKSVAQHPSARRPTLRSSCTHRRTLFMMVMMIGTRIRKIFRARPARQRRQPSHSCRWHELRTLRKRGPALHPKPHMPCPRPVH